MTTTISVLQTDMTCASRLPPGGGGSSVVIRAPVGNANPPRCQNFPDDVKTIQKALNRFTPVEGGPAPRLVADGFCGPKTRKAIYHFQEKWDLKPKNWEVPDGIVDPEGPTIRRLRQGSGTIANLPVEFMARIPGVISVITAARASLTLAKTSLMRGGAPSTPQLLPSLGLGGQAAVSRVDRHFHINKLANPLARLEQIETMFLNMLTAIGYVPQGVVLAVDEPASLAVGSFMFTFEGGYHLRGRNDTFEGIPVGSIYLAPKSRTLGQDSFTYAMIHELAHFTGPTSRGIIDHAYFHKDSQRYRNLTPDLAFRNADCYSQYAFDAIGKPDFDISLRR